MTWKVQRVGVGDSLMMVSGHFYLAPQLRGMAIPLDPPCPAFPETLQQHRWAAQHDVSTRGPARVLVEMDKLMERGWSAAKAWREVVYQHRRRGAGRPSWTMWVSGKDDPSEFRKWQFMVTSRRPAFSASWHEPLSGKRRT